MSIKEKIEEDLKGALRAKEALRLSVLRMLSSALHNRGIEKRTKTGDAELIEEEQIAVLRSEAKKRKDAIVEFQKGGREDLVQKEDAELKILERYLPPELSDDDIEKAVREVIEEGGSVTSKDFGRMMGEVMKRVKGQASGERVAEVVKTVLGA